MTNIELIVKKINPIIITTNMNNYGDENTDYINDVQKIHNITYSEHRIVEYIVMKHFNKDHPENHNVYISNIHNAYANKFINNTWTLISKEELILEIINDIEFDIYNNIKELHDKLDDKTLERLKADKMTMQFKRDIYDKIKILLYEKSKLAIERREKEALCDVWSLVGDLK